ncbi:MAG: thioredoxin family protein [Myxococcota bacterium]
MQTGKRHELVLLLAIAAATVSAAPHEAASGVRGAAAYEAGEARVEAELLVDAAELRPGQVVRVGVLFKIDPGWHIYWRNSGESGLPTQIEYEFDRARVGPLRWPVPEVFHESDGFLTTYGYSDQVLLASDAVVEPRSAGTARVSVVADFVTCKLVCIPGQIALAREMPVSASGLPASPTTTALFDHWAERLPIRAEDVGIATSVSHSQSAVRPGDDFHTAIQIRCAEPAAGCVGVRLAPVESFEAFLPEVVEGVELQIVGHEPAAADGFAVIVSGRALADAPGALEQRLRGLVPVVLASGVVQHVVVEALLPRAAKEAVVIDIESPLWGVRGGFETPAASLGFVYAFGLALLGGLILNLMPCVLPILAIKVFHVAALAHESRRRVLGHGAAYTGGVLASMGVLALIVTGLRAAGTAVGWGFQFQQPLFIVAICSLLVVFALNLFGVFEVTFQPAGVAKVGAEATGLRRSFFEGLLAVILATPCTAPFLGTAVGFAFASTTPVIFAIFLAIGLGLAAPYALVTLVPGWARIVPRPGPWMLTVRKGLGFSLIAAVVWFLWVVGRGVGADAQALALGFLVAVAFGVWVFGSVQRGSSPALVATTGVALVGLVVAGLAVLPLADVGSGSRAGVLGKTSLSGASWRSYDLAAIHEELGRGRPVFVDFTADWCITCKVNESVVLEDSRVQSELARLRFVTFKADWTLYDDEIRQVLASFGRAGVPMYLVYAPNSPGHPKLLPELLTVDLVIDALRDAAGASGTRAGLEPARPAAGSRST